MKKIKSFIAVAIVASMLAVSCVPGQVNTAINLTKVVLNELPTITALITTSTKAQDYIKIAQGEFGVALSALSQYTAANATDTYQKVGAALAAAESNLSQALSVAGVSPTSKFSLAISLAISTAQAIEAVIPQPTPVTTAAVTHAQVKSAVTLPDPNALKKQFKNILGN